MNIIKVKRPDVYEPRSVSCRDHWTNMISYGRCDMCIGRGDCNF